MEPDDPKGISVEVLQNAVTFSLFIFFLNFRFLAWSSWAVAFGS
jgi:hypothetical protein